MQTVVHIVSADEAEQQTALNIVENLLADESDRIDDVAVVAQAKGINALVSGSDYEDQIRSLLDEGVPFRGCANTLAALDLEESDLMEGVETVPEGAVEVTQLQDDGYAYIRP